MASGRIDIGGLSLVGYGYTGKGVGTTALFFDGVDARGSTRRSFGGYGQASYTFYNVFTLGGSWGISVLDTANAVDTAAEFAQCTAAAKCLVHQNQSWIGFARYKLTDWVKLQAEFVHTVRATRLARRSRTMPSSRARPFSGDNLPGGKTFDHPDLESSRSGSGSNAKGKAALSERLNSTSRPKPARTLQRPGVFFGVGDRRLNVRKHRAT